MARLRLVERLSPLRVVALFVLLGGLSWSSYSVVDQLAGEQLGPRYVRRGDAAIKLGTTSEALNAYRKASAEGQQVDTRIICAQQIPVDPLQCQSLFAELGMVTQANLLIRAQAAFASPKQAALAGEQLTAEGYPEYARYALESAVSLDPDYAEGWQLLVTNYDSLAQRSTVSAGELRQLADATRKRRDLVSSKYLGL